MRRTSLTKEEKWLIVFSVLLGCAGWFFHVCLDWLFFSEVSFLDVLLVGVSAHEAFARAIFAFSFFLIGFCATIVRIRGRQSRESLAESEERYRTITEQTGQVVYDFDLKAERLNWGGAIEEVTGYTSEEFSSFGNHIREKLVDAEDIGGVVDELDRAMAECCDFDIQYRMRRKDGEYIHVEEHGSFLPDAEGVSCRMIGTMSDITERKKREAQISELSARYQAILSAIPDIVTEVDNDKILRWTNAAGYEFYGRDVIGKEASYYFEGEQDTYEKVSPLFAGDESVIYVRSWQRRRDGAKRLLEWRCRVLKDSEGNVTGALSTARDITDIQYAQDAIKEARDKYEALLENIPDAVYSALADERYTTIFMSRRWYDWTGYQPEELYSSDLPDDFNSIHPEDRDSVLEQFKEICKGRKEYVLEYRIVHKDTGQIRHIRDRGRPVMDANGKLLRFDGVLADITVQKEALEQIEKSERNYREIYNATNEALFIHDADTGEILDVNETMVQMFGYSYDEVLKKNIGDMSFGEPPYTQKKAQEWVRKTAHEGPQIFEWLCRKKGGELLWAEVNLKRGVIGGQERVIAVVRDISGRKRSEQEREALMRDLSIKNKELENIVYATSHDLRSPLVNVQGFASELEHSFDELKELLFDEITGKPLPGRVSQIIEEEIPESLEFVSGGVDKMERLLGGLLRLSRTGRVSLSMKPIDMNVMFSNIIRGMHYQINREGVDVEIEELEDCIGDEGQINQVFTNLLDNAIKYRAVERGCNIRISSTIDGRQAVYCVEDNGVGIGEDYLEKIFEMFHQLDPQAEKGGEGVGLTIVRSILDRHYGSIWVESREGEGSRFYVSLPHVIKEEPTKEE